MNLQLAPALAGFTFDFTLRLDIRRSCRDVLNRRVALPSAEGHLKLPDAETQLEEVRHRLLSHLPPL